MTCRGLYSSNSYTMKMLPWDQKIARVLVRPFRDSNLRPNHITFVTLALAIISGYLFAQNKGPLDNWAAGIFIFARFLDHFDGELARLQGSSSRFGYYFDYVSGGLGYSALFMGLGIGHWQNSLEEWGLLLGVAGVSAAIFSMLTNFGIDKISDDIKNGDSIGYPDFAGFELEDGIYLLGPVTWFGYITPFFVAAGIGSFCYFLWSLFVFIKLRAKKSNL